MYYLVYVIFYGFSLLPLRILYLISDFLFFTVYHLIGYRRKIVSANLLNAFPEKSEKERLKIEKLFFRNLMDSVVETFKTLSASPNFLLRRVTANWEILERLHQSGKNCQIHLGHTFNWEWGHHVLQLNTDFQVLVVYGPLNNKIFERLLLKIRTRMGSDFIPSSEIKTAISMYNNTQYLLGLVADQSPSKPQQAYWMNFLHQPTGFIPGPERAARNLNIPVLFASITKKSRGRYHAELQIVSENPGSLKEGELTRKYATLLEQNIRQQPENWLWSHRRWKHPFKDAYKDQWIDTEARPDNTSIRLH